MSSTPQPYVYDWRAIHGLLLLGRRFEGGQFSKDDVHTMSAFLQAHAETYPGFACVPGDSRTAMQSRESLFGGRVLRGPLVIGLIVADADACEVEQFEDAFVEVSAGEIQAKREVLKRHDSLWKALAQEVSDEARALLTQSADDALYFAGCGGRFIARCITDTEVFMLDAINSGKPEAILEIPLDADAEAFYTVTISNG